MMPKGSKHTLATRKKIAESAIRFPISDLINKTTEYMGMFQNLEHGVPTHAGLIVHIGCSRALFYQKIQKSEELAKLIDLMDSMREDRLIQGGVTKKLDSGFSQFLLKTKHGYNEQPTQLVQNNYSISQDLIADALKMIKG
jgi:hypothetical protein